VVKSANPTVEVADVKEILQLALAQRGQVVLFAVDVVCCLFVEKRSSEKNKK
jgi:hypothetical protein